MNVYALPRIVFGDREALRECCFIPVAVLWRVAELFVLLGKATNGCPKHLEFDQGAMKVAEDPDYEVEHHFPAAVCQASSEA